MRIATILGSPRKKGNTNRVLGWIEEAVQRQGHQVNRINLVDHKINGCKGCFTCKKFTEKPGCPQNDDAVELLNGLISSDLILYASPIYFWGPTAQMKTFVDRHCSLVTGFGTPQWRSLVTGRRIGLVVTCEDGVGDNTELLDETFRRLAGYLGCDHAGTLVAPFMTSPDAIGGHVKEQAVAFAGKLTETGQPPAE
ncbi:MAG: flavodoxin family protein [Desulfomonile tiedjei]|nr:flavodoxin family protein [Desulfomonile tiedjei]